MALPRLQEAKRKEGKLRRASPKKARSKKPGAMKPCLAEGRRSTSSGNPYVDGPGSRQAALLSARPCRTGKDERMTLLVQLEGISAEEFVAGDSCSRTEPAAGVADFVRHPVPRRAQRSSCRQEEPTG
jgi:hypothetical protein